MKILQLKFSNINSLRGNYIIDFTDPKIEESGIFVIVGPTGAGKSTILDAITLALFGKTPRLSGKSSETEALMTRGTNESSAEVVITTNHNSKSYKIISKWLRKRSNSSATSKLSEPVMFLDCYIYNKITNDYELCQEYSTKGVSKVSKVIETLLGLDFQRFTKTCLLAQNQFSAFLDAETKEKAKILEDITSQHIFSLISITVHNKLKIEQDKLNSLQQQMLLYTPMPENELKNLQQIYSKTSIYKDYLQNQIKTVENLIEKKQKLINFQEKLNIHNQTKLQIQQEIENKKSLFIKLDYAKKVEPFRYYVQKIKDLNSKLKSTSDALAETNSKFTLTLNDLNETKEKLDISHKNLINLKSQLESFRPIFTEVRKIDSCITNQLQILSEIEQEIKEINSKNSKLSEELKNNDSNLKIIESNILNVQQFLANNTSESQIKIDLNTLEKTSKDINNIKQNLLTYLRDKEKLINKQSQIKSKLENFRNSKNSIENKITQIKQTIEYTSNQMQEILKGNTINSLHDTIVDLSALKSNLEQLISKIENLHNIKHKISTITTEINNAFKINSNIEIKISRFTKDLEKLEETKNQLTQEIIKLQLTASLEHQRANLKDGEPCPLCGSTVHPYKNKNIQLSKELEEKNLFLSDLQSKISELQTNKDIVQNLIIDTKNILDKIANIKSCNTLLPELASLSKNSLDSFSKCKNLEELLETISINVDLLNPIIAKASTLADNYQNKIKDYEVLNSKLNEAQKELNELQKQLEYLITNQNNSDIELTKTNSEISFIDEKITNLKSETILILQSLNNILTNHSDLKSEYYKEIDSLANQQNFFKEEYFESINKIFNELLQRLNNKLSEIYLKTEELQKLNKQKIEFENKIEKNKTQILELSSRLQNLNQKKEEALEEIKKFKTQREKIFGNKNVDEEENKLYDEYSKIEKEYNELHEKYTTTSINYQKLKTDVERYNLEIQNLKNEYETIINEVQSKLQNSEFNSLSELENYILSHNEINHIESIKNELENKLSKICGQIEELTTTIENVKKELRSAYNNAIAYYQTTDRKETIDINCILDFNKLIENNNSIEDLNNIYHSLKSELDKTENDLQSLTTKISTEQDKISKYDMLKGQIELSQQQLDPLIILDKLIGSSDGKKYLEFAQSITFRHLISAANNYLEILYNRYRLTCEGLEIKVIDKYLYNKASTIKNLSGGEKFLVSLALALALSQFIGLNHQIESLFIDEGFGMLDRNTLEIALHALINLQNQGKTIGLITHLDFIKERIPAVIEVVPLGNGYSTIRGCGCKQQTIV